ncbi:MAG: hypothetical protein JO111_03785 [Caulobacteraceae bacterium]|nr:hypothetical protein [Caulobacteraceae bacterium]
MSSKRDQDKATDDRASSPQSHADRAAECAPGDLKPGEDLSERQEKLIDEAVQETFPASDPISPKRIT